MIVHTEIRGGGRIQPDGAQYGRVLLAVDDSGDTMRFPISARGRVRIIVGTACYWFKVHGDPRDIDRLNEALNYIDEYA